MVSPWITGALGWAFMGPIGGILGYAAGSLFNSASRAASRGSARDDFLASVLVLTAAVMKADGRASKSELGVVKEFLSRQFGPATAQDALRMLRDLLQKDIPTGPVCEQISANMNYSQRLALLHFLFCIAHADGEFHPSEDRLLQQLASELGLRAGDIRSIAAMFAPKADPAADYRVLEISPEASDDEVRKAFRRMSMKHHPDKVAHLGPEFQKAATEKFQRVNAAYAHIKKIRGMA